MQRKWRMRYNAQCSKCTAMIRKPKEYKLLYFNYFIHKNILEYIVAA